MLDSFEAAGREPSEAYIGFSGSESRKPHPAKNAFGIGVEIAVVFFECQLFVKNPSVHVGMIVSPERSLSSANQLSFKHLRMFSYHASEHFIKHHAV